MSDIYGIAKSGLQAYKESLATTGQNIANVGNENYARREVNLTEVRSATADVLSISSNTSYGVKIDGITRAFDQFIDLQLQTASSGLSFATSQTLILEKLEQVLRPSDSTVSTKLNDFFSSLSTVSQDPSDLAARNIAIDAGRALVSEITNVANGINNIRKLVSDTLSGNIKDFNNTLGLLSSVQKEILGNSSPKSTPNSLLDQRDAHLKTLSELADISVEYQQNGSVKVTLGTSGQGQTLINDLDHRTLVHRSENGSSSIFLSGNGSDVASRIQIQSGEIAGNLAADVTLTSTKNSLDDLAVALTNEFNEVHRFGVDLNGDTGLDFFTLEAVEIKKTSMRDSTAQIRVEGNLANKLGTSLRVSYDPTKESWAISDTNGEILQEFKGSTEIDGVRFSIEGRAALGDSFNIQFTNGSAENLRLKILDGKKIAASSYYSVEPAVANSSNANITIERFNEGREDNLVNLNSVFSQTRDAANPISFVSAGALGYLENVDSIKDLTTLKSQASIQFSTALSDLDTNSKLKITLGSTEYTFSVGNFISDVSDYREIAEILNEGNLKSDTGSYSFTDLGLFAGGNDYSLSVSSAAQPPYSGFQKINSGTLNNFSGLLKPADEGTAKLQVFTREGIQLSGEPLTEEEANELISKTNGFTTDAKYSAKYTAVGSNDTYIGAEISRITTTGAQTKVISGIGFSNNLNSYASNSFPSSRAAMPSNISINTDAGRTGEISVPQGMMAGQIAEKINSEVGAFGIDALASNRLELFNFQDGRIQFDLYGDNSEASAIDVTISNNDTQGLVSEINSKSVETGISASVSGTGAILLSKIDGNDLAIKNFSIASGTISARQIDKFGEAIQSSPVVVSDTEHLISGGQIELRSPASFDLEIDGVTQTSAASSFEDGFVNKIHNSEENQTEYSFAASSLVDGNLLDVHQLNAVASSSSYQVTLASDNSNQDITAAFSPRVYSEFSSNEISSNLVKAIRADTPKSRFTGDDFTLSDGFPSNGSKFELTLGEQNYVATLNTSLEYTISGSTVNIGSESFTLSEALERIVAASTFSVTGPEVGRLNVGFEQNGSSFRFFASAYDGVLSGHALVAASTNSADQKSAFHISDTSGAEILTGEFDLTQNDQTDFAEIVIGATTYSLSFETTGDTITSVPALPAGVVVSTVSTGTNLAKMKIEIAESVAEKDIRLKGTDNSTTFGFITAGSQVTLDGNKFLLSNYDNNRITTTSEVSSLADEILSFDGLSGEDLIILSTGDRKPSVIGNMTELSQELNPREMTAKVNSTNASVIDIFDTKSGDFLGSRTLSSTNNFLFRDFDWILDGNVSAGDEFQVLTSNERKDDGTNLARMIALSSFSESTGKGGYTEQYNSLVTSAGYQIRASEQNLINAKVAHDIAVDRKSEFSGVDLDTEAAKLLEQQQAYQALARVLTTAKELLDTLLRSM